MVPSAIVLLERLPLNSNGKLDRKALPDPELHDAGIYEPPPGPIETALADVWAEVLGAERIGRYDNFFELGGHSVAATRCGCVMAEASRDDLVSCAPSSKRRPSRRSRAIAN